MLLTFLLSVALAQFADIPPEHWAEQAVEELNDLGVITGFPDGSFRGELAITRYEAALMIYRLLNTFDVAGSPDLAETERLIVELELLKGELFGADGESQFDLSLVNDTLNKIDAIAERLDQFEQDAPSTIALYDQIRNNLVQLEQGFNRGDLSIKEDVLTELDMRFAEFRAAIEQSFVTYVEEQLATYDQTLGAKLSDFEQRLGQQEDAVGALETDALQLEGRLQSDMRELEERLANASDAAFKGAVRVGGGFEGETPIYLVETILTRDSATITGVLDSGELSLLGSYDFGFVELGGRYHIEPESSSSLGALQAGIDLEPLSLRADAAYADAPEFGVRIEHEGSLPSAAIRGLDAAVSARIKFDEESSTLLDAQARLGLPLSSVVITPGILYRRVSNDYQGFLGSAKLTYSLSEDVAIFAEGRYGFFDALGEGDSRNAPEGQLGLLYDNLEVVGFLNAGLPDFESYPTFFDAAPLKPQGLKFGLRASVLIGFP